MHFTLLIAFILIAWTAVIIFTQHHYHGFTALDYYPVGATIAVILFISVLCHELAMIALKYGIKIRHIMLFLFGGVSNISD